MLYCDIVPFGCHIVCGLLQINIETFIIINNLFNRHLYGYRILVKIEKEYDGRYYFLEKLL